MTKRGFIISSILLLSTLVGFGQNEVMKLSFEDAQLYALEHNKSLKVAEKDAEINEKKVWEAISQGLPSVDVNVKYATNFNYEMQFGSSGESSSPQEMIAKLDAAGVDYSQMNAGDWQTLNVMSVLSSGSSTIVLSDATTATAQVGMLLFSGAYYAGVRSAKIAAKLAQQNIDMTAFDVKEQVASSYYNAIITKESMAIIDQNLENLLEIMTHTENMYRVGMAEVTDVDQIRISVSQLENAKLSAERNLELALNLIRFQLGLDIETGIELTDDLNVVLNETQIIATSTEAFSVDQNISYQMMENQEAVTKEMVSLQKWSYGPQLTGYYAYNEKLMTSGFDMTPNHTAGLTLALPIFASGMRKSKLDQAKIELDKTQINKSLLRDQLLLQEKQYRFALDNSIENYNLQKANREVAKRVFENFRRKYEQGMVSSLDLTQANSNYLDAENNYISSSLQVLQARLALEKLFNTL